MNIETYNKPKKSTYNFYRFLFKIASKCMFNVKIKRNDLKNKKGPFLVIANHQSEIDFVNLMAAIPTQTHFVVGEAAYKASSMSKIMQKIGCLPRKGIDFSNDEINQMKTILNNDMPVAIYPIGIITENGMSTNPSVTMPSLLKSLSTDVYVAKSNGSYLTSPKWSNKRRKGRIDLEIYKLLSKDQVDNLSLEQLYDHLSINLKYNEYDYVINNHIKYKNGNNVEGLHYVLHRCPDCDNEYSIEANKDTLFCKNCGYTVKANNYGLLSLVKGSTYYKKPSDWYLDMQAILSNNTKQIPDYNFNSDGKLLMINNETSKFEEVGICKVILDETNIKLIGTIKNKPLNETLNTSSYPLVPYKPGKHIEITVNNNIYRIVFDNPYHASKFNMLLKEYNKNKN